MGDPSVDQPPPYHLYVNEREILATAQALRLLISDEAHEPQIRLLAQEVIEGLEDEPDERGILVVTLTPQQMKITHSAVRLLLKDSQREQEPEREVLRGVLEKLPDEHTMRAITIE